MKNVLVTGGAGFIGSHLCERLLNEGFKVICVDNLLTGSKKNIEHLLENKNFTFIKHNVINPALNLEHLPRTVPKALVRGRTLNVDVVYHLASPASPNPNSPISYLKLPLETLLVNSVGTKNLLELAKKFNSRFLYASTSEVYGDPKVHPQPEEYWGNVNPVGSRSCYDEGKRFGEAITMAYYRKFKLDTRIVRIFNTFGPRMLPEDGRVVSNFIVQALRGDPITVFGDGKQSRSFCFVRDLVEGILKVSQKDGLNGEIINLGNPVEYQIIKLAKLVKRLTKTRSKIIFTDLPDDDPFRRQPDITKAKKLLKWEPKIGLEDGLNKTITYFRQIIND